MIAIETTRKLKVWQASLKTARDLDRLAFLGFDICRRWQWRCYTCRIQGTHGYFTAAGACDAAREHHSEHHSGERQD